MLQIIKISTFTYKLHEANIFGFLFKSRALPKP